ncbi:MAG TPA: PEP-CTERM sorting domain-containing protein, partial [Pyrinomonadaceae bacterium]|nr:PEP-CTERM sorting domain-containing protein [Pyrinomonadaceae bacterium]
VSLQLRNGSQSGRAQAASQASPQSPAGTSSTGSASPATLISTIAAPQQGGASGLESIDQGDIEGTICDCGELALAGGGFPLWPLLGLAAIPLPFINRDETPESSPTPTPIPTPTPEPIPEPASLLLFGSGLAALGAGVRRRYMKTRVAERAATEEEV